MVRPICPSHECLQGQIDSYRFLQHYCSRLLCESTLACISVALSSVLLFAEIDTMAAASSEGAVASGGVVKAEDLLPSAFGEGARVDGSGKADDLSYDLGSLTAVDSHQVDIAKMQKKREHYLHKLTTGNVQLLVKRVFELPMEVTAQAPVVSAAVQNPHSLCSIDCSTIALHHSRRQNYPCLAPSFHGQSQCLCQSLPPSGTYLLPRRDCRSARRVVTPSTSRCRTGCLATDIRLVACVLCIQHCPLVSFVNDLVSFSLVS